MKLTTIYKLIKLGFLPIKTNLIPQAEKSLEALEYSSVSENGEKAVYILVSNSAVNKDVCFIRLDKTCGKSNTDKYYHKIIETYVEENQIINYVEDKLNITERNQILGGNN